MIRMRFSESIVAEFTTEMGETVEIDHLRDLYWAEAVLRAQSNRSDEDGVMRSIRIDDRQIDERPHAFVIAEIGVNHDGSLQRGSGAGADCKAMRCGCGEAADLHAPTN